MNTTDLKDYFQAVWVEWQRDHASRLSIAIAYFTVFAIPPTVIILLAIIGVLFEGSEVQIVDRLADFIGIQAARAVGEIIDNVGSADSERSRLASALGVVTLLVGASAVFRELRSALNIVWGVEHKGNGGWLTMLRRTLFSFGMLFAFGFLLIVSFVVSISVQVLLENIPGADAEIALLARVLNFFISLVIFGLLFALLFKMIPDVIVRWRDVLIGGFATALLFVIGQSAISLYFAQSNPESTYGAAGWIIVLLLWALFSAHIFVFGAELTQVYTKRYGAPVQPGKNAAWASPERLEQLRAGG